MDLQLFCYHHGISVHQIKVRFETEDVYVSLGAIYFLLQKYKEHQTYVDLPSNFVPMKVTDETLHGCSYLMLLYQKLTKLLSYCTA